jgi:hypothetical protein
MSLPAAFFAAPLRRPGAERLTAADGRTLRRLLAALALAGLLLESPLSFAQAAAPLAPASAAASAAKAVPVTKAAVSGPSWTELTPGQQQALMPLASNWNSINEPQKRKWLEISKNYRSMTPDEQAKLNSRMNEWVALSPQQRAQARLNFGKTTELARQLTPEEKKAKWEAYQALSPEEKEKLVVKASPTPRGAATAVKPVAPQKLAVLPAHNGKSAPKITPLPPAAPASAASAAGSAPLGAASAALQR